MDQAPARNVTFWHHAPFGNINLPDIAVDILVVQIAACAASIVEQKLESKTTGGIAINFLSRPIFGSAFLPATRIV